MTFLYEELDVLRKSGVAGAIKQVPQYLLDGLNQKLSLRPYQKEAVENFITYFENEKFRLNPSQTLFHMATGSGKTLIMAGLILYLYEQGYRNFLFFVNSTNILEKTKDNFNNPRSSKYLFSDIVLIDHEPVKVREVNNFQESDGTAINIRFATIQGLHMELDGLFPKENAMAMDDFIGKETVLLADEAHHLNVSTKTKKKNKKETEEEHNWEHTVQSILNANNKNVLLEFTATCDLENQAIKDEYTNKIVCSYPLIRFRQDRYSKEINSLRSDVSLMDRALQAVILSQYRLKVFQDHRLSVKPVILFKSLKIADSIADYQEFLGRLSSLTGNDVKSILENSSDKTLQKANLYFRSTDIEYDELAAELREDFSEEHCLLINSESITKQAQLALNSLEDANNPYRSIFAVKQLDEGWDVLNLFDIVRLYETRQSGGKSISATTISEAQLIGRGARYCPFVLQDYPEKYKRKFDYDADNPLRICEAMYYHCQNDSRYIGELHNALKEKGLEMDRQVIRNYILKTSFKMDDVYTNGRIFVNEQKLIGRPDAAGLQGKIINKTYKVKINTGLSKEESILVWVDTEDQNKKLKSKALTIKEIAEINYAIVYKAMCKNKLYRFDVLKNYYPILHSMRDFVYSPTFLGNIKIELTTAENKIDDMNTWFRAVVIVLGEIQEQIENISEVFKGTEVFRPQRISKVFKDKSMAYTNPHGDGEGVSQNDPQVSEDMRMDLSNVPWYACEDNYGTSLEKECVKDISKIVDKLREQYDKVYLIRNERQFAIYSFEHGERFEPDFVLLLRKNKTDSYEQIQVFIEPKGEHLVKDQIWKEKFLLQLKEQAKPFIEFDTNNDYKIWGFHFYRDANIDNKAFEDDVETLIKMS